MSDTIAIPEGVSERDRRRIMQVVAKARRNARIRKEYPHLKDKHGRDEALDRLAKKYCCSVSTVKHVLYRL